MTMHYKDLDEKSRSFMTQEVELDISRGNLYLSKRFTYNGRLLYPSLLLEAVKTQDEDWLKNELNNHGSFKNAEFKHARTGTTTVAHIPVTAADTFAEGEFNRFYMRAICLRAIEEGTGEVIIYRGKPVAKPRPESETLIGTKLSADTLLNDLRNPLWSRTHSGLPFGPNSGITIGLT